MLADLHIVVVDPDKERAEMIVDGLQQVDDARITVIGEVIGLERKLAALAPDIILIDLENPGRDMLADVARLSNPTQRPVAMFVDGSDTTMMSAALDAGVSAYVVDGLRSDRVKPVLEMAIARFHAFSRLTAELEATKAALSERKIVDRAKGLLMKRRSLSEEEAYALLRKTAMDQGKRVAEIAEALVTTADLLS
ncbi:MAG: ANTAR domain-containing protein [Pseudomonadota bacterium]